MRILMYIFVSPILHTVFLTTFLTILYCFQSHRIIRYSKLNYHHGEKEERWDEREGVEREGVRHRGVRQREVRQRGK